MLDVLKRIAELDLPEYEKDALFARLQPTISKLKKRMALAKRQIEAGMPDIEAENIELRKEVSELSIKEAAYLDKIAKLKAEINTTNLF